MTACQLRLGAVCCGLAMMRSALAESTTQHGPAAMGSVAGEQREDLAAEVSMDFCTRQLTYGLVDNRDPILTLAGVAEWHGFTFETAVIFDTTEWGRKHGGYGNRQGKYQEIAFGPGYTHTFTPEAVRGLPTAVELFVNYLYEYHPPVRESRGEGNPDTQFINIGMTLPDLWLAPWLTAEFDIDNECGAAYLNAGVQHTFTLIGAAGKREADPLALTVCGGVGLGNPKRNRYDAGFDTYAFKDAHLSAALEWCLTDFVVLSPYLAVYEQIHGRLRDAARRHLDGETHASTQWVGGVRLTAAF